MVHKVPRGMFAECVSLHSVATNIRWDEGLESRFKFNGGGVRFYLKNLI